MNVDDSIRLRCAMDATAISKDQKQGTFMQGRQNTEHQLSRKARSRRRVYRALAAGVINCVLLPLSLAATPSTEDAAHVQWRDTMSNLETPEVGCFQAKFPSTFWESVPCRTSSMSRHFVPREPSSAQPLYVGNAVDYVLYSSGLISKTVGSFSSVSGVVSESNVGQALFGDGGILGANEYSLQINTNNNYTDSVCSNFSTCKVWQQFVYATDYEVKGSAAAFIQYWFLNYGSTCPTGWKTSGTNCWKNSAYVTAPNVPITSLGSLKMTGTAVSGGNDSVIFTDGTVAYSVTAPDSVLQIGTVWHESEFNVVGDTDGSTAVFNQGTAIAVNVSVLDGSTASPACISNAGTTGETNILSLGSCTVAAGSTPSIQFSQTWTGWTDSPALTEGKYTRYALGDGVTTYTGFGNGLLVSISPTETSANTYSSGQPYVAIYDIVPPGGTAQAVLMLNGFQTDPGQNYLGSITVLGVTRTGASATYAYGTGQAEWTWPTKFGFTGSGTTTVQLTHQ